LSTRTLFLTVVTLLAFASNSVLCRLALAGGEIDAASFTFYRLGAGAVFLWLLVVLPNPELRRALSKSRFHPDSKTKHAAVRAMFGSWQMGFLLFAYAVCFSFAYLSLSAATGGLILFGCVQATMILVGLVKGERPSLLEWSGFVVAVIGLVYLFFPKLEAPSLVGGSLMALAGVSWGFYSLLGRGVPDATLATAGNFVRSVPFAILLAFVAVIGLTAHTTPRGVLLAVVSGAITSGLGYVVWYHALKGLTATRAAVVQLAVPVIVALGGVAFIGEPLTLSLVVSGALILGGIAIVVAGKSRR
jgi:drug/metabolite transporter (DMT)-like permease